MKKNISIITALFTVLLFASCKKDITPDISVQRPNMDTGMPSGPFAIINVRNLTGTAEALVDNIYLSVTAVTGGEFPIEKGGNTVAYTSYFGKQSLYVAVRGGLGKTIRVVDSEMKQHIKNVDVAEPKIVSFDEVSVLEERPVRIILEDGNVQ